VIDVASVLIIEDHSLLADSLAIALGAEGLSATVASLDSRDELMALVGAQRPDVVLLDLDLGAELGSGLDLVSELCAFGARVIIVSGTPSRLDFAAALERGAIGFLTKSQPLDELVATVQAAALGRPILAEGKRHQLVNELRARRSARTRELEPFTRLTPREQNVLQGLLEGLRAEDLARAASVSEATIRSQLRGVLTKLGVSSQLEAVAMARRTAWPPTG
jgi:DNA-binding NarL/FixJ family response regulator